MPCASPMQIASALDAFIRERFQVSPDDNHFSWDIDLWDEGYVDSLGTVELVHFIEASFELSVPGELLFDPDFVRIRGIARLIYELANDSIAPPRTEAAQAESDGAGPIQSQPQGLLGSSSHNGTDFGGPLVPSGAQAK